jgi:hypothetical protein
VGTSAALSDPGIYVCSTDMIFFPNTSGTWLIWFWMI